MTDLGFTMDTPHGPVRLELRDPVSLNPAARNVMQHSDAEIARLVGSIGAHGFLEVPLYNERSNRIVAGHARREGAIANHLGAIPVFVGAWDDDAEKAISVALQGKQYGEWDDAKLTDLLKELDEAGYDLDATGLEPFRIEELLGDGSGGLPGADPDDVPEPPDEPITKRGDVILLGKHRLMCGDSTNREDVEALMPSAEPILMVTDPPYGVQLDQGWRDRIQGVNRLGRAQADVMSNDDCPDWTAAWKLCRARVAFVWHAAMFSSVVKQSLEATGFEVKQQIIWAKNMAPMGRSYYHWKHEPCWFAVAKGKTIPWHVGRDQVTVWEAPSPKHIMSGSDEEKMDHPTQKPVEIFCIPMRNHTARDEAVYDPFLGSGTAIIAAEQEGRVCFGMEIDPKYCDVIVDRWESFTGKAAERPALSLASFDS